MHWKCDFSKITIEQLAVVGAVQDLLHQQGQRCVVLSLDPLMFDLSGNLTPVQKVRLIEARIPLAAKGWMGKVDGNTVSVQKEAGPQPAKRGRKKRAEGNGDLRAGDSQTLAESDLA